MILKLYKDEQVDSPAPAVGPNEPLEEAAPGRNEIYKP